VGWLWVETPSDLVAPAASCTSVANTRTTIGLCTPISFAIKVTPAERSLTSACNTDMSLSTDWTVPSREASFFSARRNITRELAESPQAALAALMGTLRSQHRFVSFRSGRQLRKARQRRPSGIESTFTPG